MHKGSLLFLFAITLLVVDSVKGVNAFAQGAKDQDGFYTMQAFGRAAQNLADMRAATKALQASNNDTLKAKTSKEWLDYARTRGTPEARLEAGNALVSTLLSNKAAPELAFQPNFLDITTKLEALEKQVNQLKQSKSAPQGSSETGSLKQDVLTLKRKCDDLERENRRLKDMIGLKADRSEVVGIAQATGKCFQGSKQEKQSSLKYLQNFK